MEAVVFPAAEGMLFAVVSVVLSVTAQVAVVAGTLSVPAGSVQTED